MSLGSIARVGCFASLLCAARAPDDRQIALDASSRPQRFELSFVLGEEGRCDLSVELRSTATPTTAPPASDSTIERLDLQFEPFEGARWHWTVRDAAATDDRAFDAAGRSTTAAPLTHFAEPQGLRYALQFTFHAGGGLTVATPEGAVLLVSTLPGPGPRMATVRSSGALHDLTVGELLNVGDADLAAALARLSATATATPPQPRAPPTPTALARVPCFGVELSPRGVPPLYAVRPIDTVTAPEGTIERLILEVRPDVEVATLIARPAVVANRSAAPARVTLLACGRPLGKADPELLAACAGWLANGECVATFDFLGGGERRVNASFDGCDDPELRLVGSSPAEVALDELAQISAWMATRPESTGCSIRVVLDDVAALALGAGVAVDGDSIGTGPAAPRPASVTLADAAVFGEEYLRARFDSDLLRMALARREHVALPDRQRPLLERMGALQPTPGARPLTLLESRAGTVTELPRTVAAGALRADLICASDFGPRAALFAGRAEFERLDPQAVLIGCGGAIDSLDAAVATLVELITRRGRDGAAGKCRLFGEGAWGVVVLLAATRAPEQIESVVTRDAPPSFEMLLRRPLDSVRAEPRFGLLSQGQPEALFLTDACSRFELEECVLALRAANVKVEWRAPVDALRRPLTRHQRLSMWPRVRHLDLRSR